MKPLDKLARDICWLGFSKEGRVGKTKASYWKSLPEETREGYRKEAAHFVWLYDNLPTDWMGPLSFRI